METQNKESWSDRPLEDPKADRLGYAAFAEHLAQAIAKSPTDDGVVIGIYGPWGAGKSTLLNFVLHFLRIPKGEVELIHVPFAPWLYSGQEALAARFFAQILYHLEKRKLLGWKLRTTLGRFAKFAADLPVETYGIAWLASKILPGEVDAIEQKKSVDKLLKAKNLRFVVTIDDIDRLTSQEHCQVFQLIKSIADFSNITYILAFDKSVVARSLDRVQGGKGEDYLEKIVQVPFELPLPDRAALQKLLFEKLDAILSGTDDRAFDRQYWLNVYLDGIDPFIRTPRDVTRLTNTLSVTYGAVKGEVNAVDFIAIETLRVFVSEAYEVIRINQTHFTGAVESRMAFDKVGGLGEFHDVWLGKMDTSKRPAVEAIIKRLFPRLTGNYPSDWEGRWRRERRVCSDEMFSIYFRLVVPAGKVSHSVMTDLIGLFDEPSSLKEMLLALARNKDGGGRSQAGVVLDRIRDYIEDLSVAQIRHLIWVIFDIGDEFLGDSEDVSSLFSFGNDVRVGRIVFAALKRIEEHDRFDFLRSAFVEGNAFTAMEDLVVPLGQQHGKWSSAPSPESDRLLSAEHLESLEQIVLDKIRDASHSNALLQSPRLPSVLHRWQAWAGIEEARSWTSQAVGSEEGLISFLEAFLSKSYSQSSGDVGVKTIHRLDPKWMEPFVDAQKLEPRVRLLAGRSDLTANQRLAIQQFLREYDIRQSGKEPERVVMRGRVE